MENMENKLGKLNRNGLKRGYKKAKHGNVKYGYSKLKNVKLFEEFEGIEEEYEMDLDNGEVATEHAKAVIDRAMENNKNSENPDQWDLVAAFNEICKENDINADEEGDDRKGMIASALNDLLDVLSGQARNLLK